MAATKFYATLDFDGETIHENADIFAFDTRAEAEAYLVNGIDLDEWTAGIEEGRFADCWFKAHSEPDEGSDYLAPFAMDDLIVQRPGQHPGGNRYWITPRAEVLVAVLTPAGGAQ